MKYTPAWCESRDIGFSHAVVHHAYESPPTVHSLLLQYIANELEEILSVPGEAVTRPFG